MKKRFSFHVKRRRHDTTTTTNEKGLDTHQTRGGVLSAIKEPQQLHASESTDLDASCDLTEFLGKLDTIPKGALDSYEADTATSSSANYNSNSSRRRQRRRQHIWLTQSESSLQPAIEIESDRDRDRDHDHDDEAAAAADSMLWSVDSCSRSRAKSHSHHTSSYSHSRGSLASASASSASSATTSSSISSASGGGGFGVQYRHGGHGVAAVAAEAMEHLLARRESRHRLKAHEPARRARSADPPGNDDRSRSRGRHQPPNASPPAHSKMVDSDPAPLPAPAAPLATSRATGAKKGGANLPPAPLAPPPWRTSKAQSHSPDWTSSAKSAAAKWKLPPTSAPTQSAQPLGLQRQRSSSCTAAGSIRRKKSPSPRPPSSRPPTKVVPRPPNSAPPRPAPPAMPSPPAALATPGSSKPTPPRHSPYMVPTPPRRSAPPAPLSPNSASSAVVAAAVVVPLSPQSSPRRPRRNVALQSSSASSAKAAAAVVAPLSPQRSPRLPRRSGALQSSSVTFADEVRSPQLKSSSLSLADASRNLRSLASPTARQVSPRSLSPIPSERCWVPEENQRLEESVRFENREWLTPFANLTVPPDNVRPSSRSSPSSPTAHHTSMSPTRAPHLSSATVHIMCTSPRTTSNSPPPRSPDMRPRHAGAPEASRPLSYPTQTRRRRSVPASPPNSSCRGPLLSNLKALGKHTHATHGQRHPERSGPTSSATAQQRNEPRSVYNVSGPGMYALPGVPESGASRPSHRSRSRNTQPFVIPGPPAWEPPVTPVTPTNRHASDLTQGFAFKKPAHLTNHSMALPDFKKPAHLSQRGKPKRDFQLSAHDPQQRESRGRRRSEYTNQSLQSSSLPVATSSKSRSRSQQPQHRPGMYFASSKKSRSPSRPSGRSGSGRSGSGHSRTAREHQAAKQTSSPLSSQTHFVQGTKQASSPLSSQTHFVQGAKQPSSHLSQPAFIRRGRQPARSMDQQQPPSAPASSKATNTSSTSTSSYHLSTGPIQLAAPVVRRPSHFVTRSAPHSPLFGAAQPPAAAAVSGTHDDATSRSRSKSSAPPGVAPLKFKMPNAQRSRSRRHRA